MNKKIMGLSLVSFLASIAGIVVSFLLLKEDVISTARTLFDYFPQKYGVVPSASWEGALVLGVFISILQIVSTSVAFSEKFSTLIRVGAGAVLLASCGFDNWTDIVFRSGYLTGNTKIAVVTTLAFYTFGSEIAQSLSWLVFISVWRLAISDLMWGYAKFLAGMKSIAGEWENFKRAAKNKEEKERDLHKDTRPMGERPPTYKKPPYPNHSVNASPKPVFKINKKPDDGPRMFRKEE